MTSTRYYYECARDDAKSTALEFFDLIVEALINKGEAPDDLNVYPDGDSYHHEHHVDHYYDLTSAAELLDQLRIWEEVDEGLWQGQAPRDAIATQAAYTYGNCVYRHWQRLIEEINDDSILADMIADKAGEDVIGERVREIIQEYN